MSNSHIDIERPNVEPVIYAYALPEVPSHNGYLKIGYSSRSLKRRISDQTSTAALNPKIVFQHSALRSDGTGFRDSDIHRILERWKKPHFCHENTRNEWYKCSIEDIEAAIRELNTGIRLDRERNQTFQLRPEQQYAIDKTINYFNSITKQDPNIRPKFLWNAKMRFGKTFASYKLAQKMGFKRVLILTFKPVVESAWQEDLETHVDFKDWIFISTQKAYKENTSIDRLYQQARKASPIVVFCSFQDALGVNENGGIKVKNEFIHSEDWDLVIFDEYHFGSWRENAKKLFETPSEESEEAVDFDSEKYQEKEADNAYNESFLPITTKYYLYLSGTPFRALNNGEFIEEQIFSWTYNDEQAAKENWSKNHEGANPYTSLPKMCLLTYQLPDEVRRVAERGENNEFTLNLFFSAKSPTKDPKDARFVYEDEVQKWLNIIRGSYAASYADDLKLGKKRPPMPFSHAPLLRTLNHTLWFLPDVASCYAMKNLLSEPQNIFYHDYTINVCAGTQAGIGLKALEPVRGSMRDPLQSKTITLTCGKLTTGVTVRPWTGIFMLRQLKSPETYFQSAFRVQSPWVIKDEEGKDCILKEICFIFDFDINRALRQVAEYGCRLDLSDSNPEEKIRNFTHFLPILAYDGSSMKEVSAEEILDIAMSGTSAALLARRWESTLLVNTDNDTLRRIAENEAALNAIMQIEGFRSVNRSIFQTIVNQSSAVKQAKAERVQKMSPSEKRELDEQDKATKSLRKQVQEKLVKFITRIPIFMYLTDHREYTLQEVITELEPALFKRVTGLNVVDFELLCEVGVFNKTLMNDAIYKFKRYEDSSLGYAGINLHDQDQVVGGWDSTISRQEFFDRPISDTPDDASESFGFSEATNSSTPPPAQSLSDPSAIQNSTDFSSSNSGSSAPSSDNSLIDISYQTLSAGDYVYHKIFGEGRISAIDHTQGRIKVIFKTGNKMFNFPDSFTSGYLFCTKPE